MHLRCLAWLVAVASVGCAHTVHVEHAPAAALAVPVERVAVVARDRECRPVADALITELRERDLVGTLSGARITVDPRAAMRIDLVACGEAYQATLVQRAGGGSAEQTRSTVDGRGHAVAVIRTGENVHAHLIGAGREGRVGGWAAGDSLPALNAAVHRALATAVARDLADQIAPVPTLVERRVWPNAADGTARRFHSLAVNAERDGDLQAAYDLARAAYRERPSERQAAYIAELARLRAQGDPLRSLAADRPPDASDVAPGAAPAEGSP